MQKTDTAAAEKAVILAYFQRELANNPELEQHIKAAVDLRNKLRSGTAALPADIDIRFLDDDTAQLFSAFVIAARG